MTHLNYSSLNISGRFIPSESSMLAIEKTFPSETFSIFLEKHERWIGFQTYLIDTQLLGYKYKNYQQLLEVGFDEKTIDFYLQCELIKEWHELRVNFTGGDRQTNKRSISGVVKYLKGKKKREDLNLTPKLCYEELFDHQNHETYLLALEYRIACDYLACVIQMKSILIKYSDYAKHLQLEKAVILKELTTEVEKYPKIQYKFICPFCKECSMVDRGKKPSDCKSPKCKKEYKQKEEKKRPPKPPKPTKADAGWVVAFGSKQKICLGVLCDEQGGRWRKVNNQVICFDCYQENKSENRNPHN